MMMKSRSKSRAFKIVGLLILAGLVFYFRFSILQLTSPLTDSIGYTIDRFTRSKTTLLRENQQLQKQVSNLLVENQQLANELRGTSQITSFSDQSIIIDQVTITSIPPFGSRFSNTGYGLSDLDSSSSAGRDWLVSADNFLYGIMTDQSYFRPFNTIDGIQVFLDDGSVTTITKIPRPYIYQIELPTDITEPSGLIEVQSQKVLGFLVDRISLNPTTDIVTYRLPILPQLYQSVQIIKVN